MPRELPFIDIDHDASLIRLVEHVRSSHEPQALRMDGEEVAIIMPARRARPAARRMPFTMNDPIWNLRGSGRSSATDVSEQTDTYLAEAYLDNHALD